MTPPPLQIVRVTPEDIRRGKRRDPLSCPLALALRRETGKRLAVMRGEVVDFGGLPAKTIRRGAADPDSLHAEVLCENWEWAWGLSRQARAEVARFDATGDCAPFQVEVPPEDMDWDDHRWMDCYDGPGIER